jgi:hypothetical protein
MANSLDDHSWWWCLGTLRLAAIISSPHGKMLVNLFIIGAMKSGTHAAHAVLGSHPAITASREKEPCHFADKTELARIWPKMLSYQDMDAYMALFDVSPGTRYLCEASTHYSMLPDATGAARRIHAYNPDARLVYMVRDPLRRIISQFFQERRTASLRGPFTATVSQDRRFVHYGDYAMQLAPYLDLFPHENIRVVVAERFQADTVSEAAQLFHWLELDPAEARAEAGEYHATPAIVGLPRGMLARTRVRDTALWKLGRKYAPRPLERLVKGLLYTDNLKPSDIRAADIDEATTAQVAANARAFYDLIGGPIPEWRDTNEAIARYAG